MARTVVTYDAGTWDVAGVAPSSSPVTVTDATLSTSDITTNNVSTSKHGFAPKAPNVATQYLDGTGAYSTPSGSGITKVPVTFSRRNGADYALNNNSSFAAVDATNLNLTIAAATGDVLEISLAARCGNEAVNAFLDAATIVSAAAVNYVSGGTGLSTNFGVGGWLLLSGVAQAFGGSTFYAVQAGDISGGNVVVRLMYRTSAASNKTLRAGTSSAEALFFAIKNLLH